MATAKARAKAQLKMHYRISGPSAAWPMARCGKRIDGKNGTTARALVTCGNCVAAMKRDQLKVKG